MVLENVIWSVLLKMPRALCWKIRRNFLEKNFFPFLWFRHKSHINTDYLSVIVQVSLQLFGLRIIISMNRSIANFHNSKEKLQLWSIMPWFGAISLHRTAVNQMILVMFPIASTFSTFSTFLSWSNRNSQTRLLLPCVCVPMRTLAFSHYIWFPSNSPDKWNESDA